MVRKPGIAVAGADSAKSLAFEITLEDVDNLGLVLDDQNKCVVVACFSIDRKI
jgi:hypothetical protein